jgi:hypothetical protein
VSELVNLRMYVPSNIDWIWFLPFRVADQNQAQTELHTFRLDPIQALLTGLTLLVIVLVLWGGLISESSQKNKQPRHVVYGKKQKLNMTMIVIIPMQ